MPDIEPIQHALEEAAGPDKIPGIAAAVATADGVIFEGAVGRKSLGSPAPMTTDSVFRIASMTKAITGAAAMQLVEQGKLALDQPAKEILPLLGKVQVLTGFDASGPVMRQPRIDITLRHLLTHTAGFAYDIWNADIARYAREKKVPAMRTGKLAALNVPLVRDPGERWEYGVNIDMVGRMVEAAGGLDLDAYLQTHILMPLGMRDTSYIAQASWDNRLAGMHARKADGTLEAIASPPIDEATREFFPGGGGLYSTAPDYLRFLRALLKGGELDGARILKPETVALMGENHMGPLNVEPLPTSDPQLSNVVDLMPGIVKKWGLTFLINTEDVESFRSAGSLTWGGVHNTYFWIDLKKRITAVALMQILPIGDPHVQETMIAFERTLYAAISSVA